ncbi:Beta-glucanase [Dactylella cylindrospora]|nr:Beta-glucanase [Dactylella cylindrospora]
MFFRSFLLSAGILTRIVSVNGRAVPPLLKRDSPPIKPGFSLTWSEEFNGPYGQLPDTNTWQIDTGFSYPGGPWNWGTGEIQSYTSDTANLRVDGSGSLNIIPLKSNGGWTSGRIETKSADFVCQPGGQMIIEGSIMLPESDPAIQSGIWPAFWALGKSYRDTNFQGWPMCGEWDILEAANGGNTAHGTLHCGVNPGGPCQETAGLSSSTSFSRGTFNTYSIRMDRTASSWEDEYLAWSINGREYYRVTGSRVGDYNTWDNLAHKPFFILLNVAVGGGFPDALAGSRTPNDATAGGDASRMVVDWVAVYNSIEGGINDTIPPNTVTENTNASPSVPQTPLSPSSFPPGETIQCATASQASGKSFNVDDPYVATVNSACWQLFPSGSRWVDKGSPYEVTLTVDGSSVTFSINIHIGGFTMPQSLCVQQFTRISSDCRSGSAPITYGGCVYSSDNNLQTCVLPV